MLENTEGYSSVFRYLKGIKIEKTHRSIHFIAGVWMPKNRYCNKQPKAWRSFWS